MVEDKESQKKGEQKKLEQQKEAPKLGNDGKKFPIKKPDHKLSTNYQDTELKVLNKVVHGRQKLTFGQRASDKLTIVAGSWSFIIGLLVVLAIWVAINFYGWVKAWDPYPFILLNLILSCLAAIQAPIILMSQNRQAERDRIKFERDFAVNTKAEKEIENIQLDLDEIKKILKKNQG